MSDDVKLNIIDSGELWTNSVGTHWARYSGFVCVKCRNVIPADIGQKFIAEVAKNGDFVVYCQACKPLPEGE